MNLLCLPCLMVTNYEGQSFPSLTYQDGQPVLYDRCVLPGQVSCYCCDSSILYFHGSIRLLSCKAYMKNLLAYAFKIKCLLSEYGSEVFYLKSVLLTPLITDKILTK
jgi:hypothetical protein